MRRFCLVVLCCIFYSLIMAQNPGDKAEQTADETPTYSTELFQKAISGDTVAQSTLGDVYHKGQGVAQDYMEAVKWYRMAAEQGEASAQHNLGFMYFKGQGVALDYQEAYFWILLARANGDRELFELGGNILQELENELSPLQKDQLQERASKWFSEHQ